MGQGDQAYQGDRGNRTGRGDRAYQSDRGDRAGRGDRAYQAGRGDRAYQGDRGNRTGRGDQAYRGDRGDRAGRGDGAYQGERAERGPEVPAAITAEQLDPEARAELRTLPGDLADAVARRLVAASLEEDPTQAYRYAQAARRLAARVGVVRETTGIAAYRAGEWADALTELRAARRLTGRATYLPLMADSERALGRLDRALDLVTGPESRDVDRATAIELRIVESGIRRDQELPDAAVAALQVPELTDRRIRPGSARLYYAYADALLDAGREDEAREWFGKAAAADRDDLTDAAERYEELDPVVFDYFADDDEPDPDEADLDEAALDGTDPDEADSDETHLPDEPDSGK